MRWRVGLIFTAFSTLVLSLAACTRQLHPEPPCNFVQNNDLRRVSWKLLTPVRLYVHRSLPLQQYPEMENLLREAVRSWNLVLGREILILEAFNVGGNDVPQKDGYSMIYWMSDTWEASRSREQARTTIYWSGSQIYEADIRINAHDHEIYVGHETVFQGVDFLSLMIHELGHVLGLAHNSTLHSVMNVALNDGLDRRQISRSDIDSVQCEY